MCGERGLNPLAAYVGGGGGVAMVKMFWFKYHCRVLMLCLFGHVTRGIQLPIVCTT